MKVRNILNTETLYDTNTKIIIRSLGVISIFLGILLNQYFLMWLLPLPYISLFKSVLLLIYNLMAIIFGTIIIIKEKNISSFIVKRKKELLLLCGSLFFVLLVLEILLRICLFNPSCDVPLVKLASHYSNDDDTDYWYYRHIFTRNIEIKNKQTEFYSNWEVSLQPDPLLGYSRKKDVNIPCHETSNLGTRGAKNYTFQGKKIIFYGDSFTESNACSNNTITSKIENKTKIETLNYGVGGYGLDQIFLLFKNSYKQFNTSQGIFLIGLIHEDIDRVTLRGRTTSKPYFTISNNRLQLHTEHIDANNLASYFETYKPKSKVYIVNLLLAKIGVRDLWNSYLKKKNIEIKKSITALILKDVKTIQKNNNLKVYFVVFYPKFLYLGYKDWKIEFLESQFKEYDLEYIDLRECLLKYQQIRDIPFKDLYVAGHPTSESNNVLAECIIYDINLSSMQKS